MVEVVRNVTEENYRFRLQ